MRESGPTLKEHLGTEYEITSIFKHNAHLTNVTEDLWKLGNNLIKPDHIMIVGEPGNSLGINYHYSNEKDTNFIAESSNYIHIRFANLFQRHDKPWRIYWKVWSVNLKLDRTLLGCGKSHTCVIEITSFQR